MYLIIYVIIVYICIIFSFINSGGFINYSFIGFSSFTNSGYNVVTCHQLTEPW